jgi:ABC-2 type transport system permease protein
MRRMRFLIWKELIELRSDPRLAAIVVVAPLLQLLMLGYAATTDINNVPVVIGDGDRSAASRDLIARFEASPSFSVVSVVSGLNEVDPFLERGTAWMALSIPAGFGRRIQEGDPQALQIVADGSDANRATVSLGYAGNLIAQFGQEMAVARAPVAPRASSRASASGSIPGWRAATSWCPASSRCFSWSSPPISRRWGSFARRSSAPSSS